MILMYHKVHPNSPTMWWVTVDSFYRQLVELQSWDVVYLDDYDPQNPRHAVITFDGIYQNILQFAAPLLKQFKYPFELFVSGDHIGKSNEFDQVEPLARFTTIAELRELERIGGRIQWHTQSHPDLQKLSFDAIQTEVIAPAELKAQFSSNAFRWFAYPYGNFNDEAYEAARKHYSGAVTCNQGNDSDRYKLNRVTVTNESSFARGKISVVIASYNYGAFLPEAIESVLRQSISPHEILIVDDHSSDETQTIGEEYQRLFPERIKFHRNSQNLGIVKNFNHAVDRCGGDYVCILGADNRLFGNYLEQCIRILEQEPLVGIAYTDLYMFGERASILAEDLKAIAMVENKPKGFYVSMPTPESTEQLDAIRKQNFIHGSSVFRKDAFSKVGGYLEKEDAPEDHELFIRILQAGYHARKAATALEYRQHSRTQANERLKSYQLLSFYKQKAIRLEGELLGIYRSRSYQMSRMLGQICSIQTYKKLFRTIRKDGLSAALALIARNVRPQRPE